MATTKNLALSKINGSDVVNPSVFNTNYDILDKLGVDYITSRGTSNGWWFRKWKSGRAECGIDDKNFGTIALNNQVGSAKLEGWKCSAQKTFGNFPFAFKSRPFVSIVLNSSSPGVQACYVSQQNSTSTKASPKFRLVGSTAKTFTNAHFGIYVCGSI